MMTKCGTVPHFINAAHSKFAHVPRFRLVLGKDCKALRAAHPIRQRHVRTNSEKIKSYFPLFSPLPLTTTTTETDTLGSGVYDDRGPCTHILSDPHSVLAVIMLGSGEFDPQTHP